MRRARREVVNARAAEAASCWGAGRGSARIGDGELLEGAWPEVAHIMDIVALEQLRDAASLRRAHWNTQQQVAAQLPPGAEMVPVSWKLNVP